MFAFYHGSTSRRLTVLALFLSMLAMGVTAPKPAAAICTVFCVDATAATKAETTSLLAQWATNFAKWAQQFELLTQIIQIVTTISNLLGDFMELFGDSMNVLIATIHVENALKSKMEILMHKDKMNVLTETPLAAVEAKLSGKHALPPDPKNRQHCYTPVVRMGLGLESFPAMVGKTVDEAINNSWRGPGMDGTGPSAAGALFMALFGKSDLGWEAMGSPVDDPPNSSMVSSDPDFYDAAINAKTLDMLLEYPPHVCVKPETECTSGKAPKPTNKEQKLWVAAELYCYLAAGPRPSPPASKSMLTPDAIVLTSQWSHCNAIRTAFVKQCRDKLKKHTRPDCTDSANDALCTFHYKICQAAKDGGVDVKNVIGDGKEDFDCKKQGLSYFQIEQLSRMACLSGQRYTDAFGGGVTGPEGTVMNDICDQSMATWRSQLAAEETAFVTALAGVQDLKSCWPDVSIKPAIAASP
jgi:hypothetical protein